MLVRVGGLCGGSGLVVGGWGGRVGRFHPRGNVYTWMEQRKMLSDRQLANPLTRSNVDHVEAGLTKPRQRVILRGLENRVVSN
jgi:hypothetical protein